MDGRDRGRGRVRTAWHYCAREGALDGNVVGVVVVCRHSEKDSVVVVVVVLLSLATLVVQILICDNSSPRSFTAVFRARLTSSSAELHPISGLTSHILSLYFCLHEKGTCYVVRFYLRQEWLSAWQALV